MNFRHFILFVIFISVASSAYAYESRDILLKQITREELKDVLVLNQQWVSYPSYNNRKGWDAFLGSFRDFYIRRGEKRLNYEWKVIKATDYIEYERSGNRSIMEDPFNSNNNAIADLLMAELAEGKGRFLDQLINGVFHTCEMTSWALSAHVPQQKSKRALPTDGEVIFDLVDGEVGNLLSWIYYFMKDEFDKVDPEITHRLRNELQNRILNPYLSNDNFWWMARKNNGSYQNNWNPWCNSNALLAFMLLENDRDTLTRMVYESMRSVDQYLNYVKSDGACDEGPSYWLNAAGRLLDYLELLSAITQDKVNVFGNQLIKNLGEYICQSYVGNGWVVNFSDASAKSTGDPYVVYRYGVSVNSVNLMHYAASIRGNYSVPVPSASMYRVLKALEVKDALSSVTTNITHPSFIWYPETELCYFSNNDGLYVAAKGGFNNESHNHNDVGSFCLYVDCQPILIDVGVGTYTRQTFSDERYDIWMMQSNYHNLPMINGVSQKDGYEYKSRNVIAKPYFFSVDIGGAYPEAAKVEKWTRSYRLKRNELRINDSFCLKEVLAPNVVNFMTWGDVEEKENGQVNITVNGVKTLLEYDNSELHLQIEPITILDNRLSMVWGDRIYRLSFTARSLSKEGNYKFTIKKNS